MTHKALKLAILLALVVALPVGCGGPKQTRRDVYVNMMTPEQRTHYLEMEREGKPISLRLAYLQEIGVYQKWSRMPKRIQEAILRRDVVEGMSPTAVRMAWGPPDQVRDVTQPAEEAAGHEKVIWDYAPGSWLGAADGKRSVCFFDDSVLWIRRE